MRRLLFWGPLALFAFVGALVGTGLIKPADRSPTTMAAKPLPALALPALLPTKPGIARTSYGGGKVRVINLFASWCVPCVAEAPQLARLKAAGVPVDGIATGDTADAVKAFLAAHGDPYERIGDDPRRQAMKALGASGVPETLVIDGAGRIVRDYASNLQPDQVDAIIALIKGGR